MIDLHCHVLPLADDGAESWETAVAMCRMSLDDGVTTLVATPHANFEYPYDRQLYLARLAELQQRVPQLKLILGCDLQVSFDNLQAALEDRGRFSIGDTRYVLVEAGQMLVPRAFLEAVYRLHAAGMCAIVTHPERIPALGRKPELLRHLVEIGCVLQITANSVTGFWGRQVQSLTEGMIREGLVGVIASDAHDAVRRTPVLSAARAAVSRMVGAAAASLIFEQRPARIIADQPIN